MYVKWQNLLVADSAAGKSCSLFDSLDIWYIILVIQFNTIPNNVMCQSSLSQHMRTIRWKSTAVVELILKTTIRSFHNNFQILCEIIQTMQIRPFLTICQAIFLQYHLNTWNTNMWGISQHIQINLVSLQTTTHIMSGHCSCLYNNPHDTNNTAN